MSKNVQNVWLDATEKDSLYDFDDIGGNSNYASTNIRNKIDSVFDTDVEVKVNLSSLRIYNTLIILSYNFINSFIKKTILGLNLLYCNRIF